MLEEGAAMGTLRPGLSILVILASGAAPCAAESDGRCSIPLKLRDGIPFVQVLVNGRGPFTFAVDTGTSREAILSPTLVKQLRLPPAGRASLLDLRGKERQPVDEVSVDTVALGGRTFRSLRALVHEPLATLAPYDGVLGFALFRDTVVTLDFPRRCLRLNEPALEEGADANVLRFSMPRNVPVVPIAVGRQTVLVQVDSGGGGINLPQSAAPGIEFARHSEIEVRAQSQLSTFFLRGGVMKGNLVLGGQVFERPFVEIGSDLPVGNLGAASLQDFAITFDQQQRLVRFHARKATHRLSQPQLMGPSGAEATNAGRKPPSSTGGD